MVRKGIGIVVLALFEGEATFDMVVRWQTQKVQVEGKVASTFFLVLPSVRGVVCTPLSRSFDSLFLSIPFRFCCLSTGNTIAYV